LSYSAFFVYKDNIVTLPKKFNSLCFLHFDVQILVALAESIEQGLALVGFCVKDEAVWGRLLHAKDVTFIMG
jgi:hypothetical protein